MNWGCPHCPQATSKEKHSNLHASRIPRPVWIGPYPNQCDSTKLFAFWKRFTKHNGGFTSRTNPPNRQKKMTPPYLSRDSSMGTAPVGSTSSANTVLSISSSLTWLITPLNACNYTHRNLCPLPNNIAQLFFSLSFTMTHQPSAKYFWCRVLKWHLQLQHQFLLKI